MYEKGEMEGNEQRRGVAGENQLTCNIESYCHVQTYSEEMKEPLVVRNRSTLTRHSKIKVTKANHATKYMFKEHRGGSYTEQEQVKTKLSYIYWTVHRLDS